MFKLLVILFVIKLYLKKLRMKIARVVMETEMQKKKRNLVTMSESIAYKLQVKKDEAQ